MSGIVRRRDGGLIVISFVAAVILGAVRLPTWIDLFWPSWLTMVLIFWCLHRPNRVGIATGWLFGLLTDLLRGGLLGQHALALALVAFLSRKSRSRLRLAPVWQQAISVFVFVLIERLLVVWIIDGMIGYPPQDLKFLMPVPITLLAWPLITLLLSDLGGIHHVD